MAEYRNVERSLHELAQGGAGLDVDALGLLTPGEVASLLHVDANTVARWCNEGRLRAIRTPGGHRRYPVSEVLRLARRGTTPVPKARTPDEPAAAQAPRTNAEVRARGPQTSGEARWPMKDS
jgi:excisionase family DNA binding protein